MSSEPPGSGDAQEKGPATESRGNVDQRSSGAGRVRWRSIVTVLGVLAVAGGIGLFLFLNQNSGSKPDQVAPVRGLACPYLQQAADAYNRGDRLAYNQAIRQAAHIAEDTLQKSGEVFGEPEHIALEIRLSHVRGISKLLSRAEEACSRLDRSSVSP
jgi:hypothetical protein